MTATHTCPAPQTHDATTGEPSAPARVGPRDHLTAGEVLALLPDLPEWPHDTAKRNMRLRGAANILTWLERHPGRGWQERWQAARGDEDTRLWAVTAGDQRCEGFRKSETQAGLGCLLQCRLILPGYGFLWAYRPKYLFGLIRRTISPELFARAEALTEQPPLDKRHTADALNTLTKLVLHTGKDLEEIGAADVEELREWSLATSGRTLKGIQTAWRLLESLGCIAPGTPWRSLVRKGQVSTAELVDAYHLRCDPVRQVLIRYLDERRASLDYGSLRQLVRLLVRNFWADIEAHHPGIDTLDLPADVVAGWKERLRFYTDRAGVRRERGNRAEVMMAVRTFYLDIQEWALTDASWAPWAVPCPVRKSDAGGMEKRKRAVAARMHQRTRERLPHLPRLVESAQKHKHDRASLLDVARQTEIDGEFTHHGRRLRRIQTRAAWRGQVSGVVLVEDVDGGEVFDAVKAEADAFWAWAIIETLRHTGVRVEELLELTHLALVSYRLPESGEVVPLLQIVPSKSDEERLLLVTPELASVLAAVVARVRDSDGTIPLVARYDLHERITGPPLPHLFQRQVGWQQEVISNATVSRLLNETLDRTGLTDAAGRPLRYTAHDFRRMFATEAVTGGLPVHIAARILGHRNLATTQAYLAVFQDDLVHTYRAFVDKRRAVRPSEEYREPTAAEWTEFQQHFELRKLELGTCGRPYGTPCNHEHACIRCPMLRVDPRQKHRLAEIIANLGERIREARMNGWLGEVEGLQVSLSAAKKKFTDLQRLSRGGHDKATDLGMPVIRAPHH